MRRNGFGILAALLLLLCAATGMRQAGAEEAKPLPELDVREYRGKILDLVELLEGTDQRKAVTAVSNRLSCSQVLQPSEIARLFQARQWDKKKILYCEMVACKKVLPAIHYVYVLVLTERGPALWEFRIFKNPYGSTTSSPKLSPKEWYIYNMALLNDLNVLGARPQLLPEFLPPVPQTSDGEPEKAK